MAQTDTPMNWFNTSKNHKKRIFFQKSCPKPKNGLNLQNLKSNFYSYYFFLGHLVVKRSAFFIRQ